MSLNTSIACALPVLYNFVFVVQPAERSRFYLKTYINYLTARCPEEVEASIKWFTIIERSQHYVLFSVFARVSSGFPCLTIRPCVRWAHTLSAARDHFSAYVCNEFTFYAGVFPGVVPICCTINILCLSSLSTVWFPPSSGSSPTSCCKCCHGQPEMSAPYDRSDVKSLYWFYCSDCRHSTFERENAWKCLLLFRIQDK